MGNWISHGWRNTEGWWEKQSLLEISASNPSEFCFNLKFFFWPTSSALIGVAWPESGNVQGKPAVGKQLCNEVIMPAQSANLVYYNEKFITLFFCLLFLFSLPILPLLAFEIWLVIIIWWDNLNFFFWMHDLRLFLFFCHPHSLTNVLTLLANNPFKVPVED